MAFGQESSMIFRIMFFWETLIAAVGYDGLGWEEI